MKKIITAAYLIPAMVFASITASAQSSSKQVKQAEPSAQPQPVKPDIDMRESSTPANLTDLHPAKLRMMNDKEVKAVEYKIETIPPALPDYRVEEKGVSKEQPPRNLHPAAKPVAATPKKGG